MDCFSDNTSLQITDSYTVVNNLAEPTRHKEERESSDNSDSDNDQCEDWER